VSNNDLERSVTDELYWDPKVDNAAIAVSADDGVVTLRGTVGSFRQKREATQDAERVFGVESVKNDLQVRIMNQDRRDDAELRGDVLQALMLDSIVPSTIDAKVDDGMVTLTGTANWQFERDEAEFVAANVLGVVSVDDEIDLVPPTRPRATSSTRSRRRWSAMRSSTPTASSSTARTGRSRSMEP